MKLLPILWILNCSLYLPLSAESMEAVFYENTPQIFSDSIQIPHKEYHPTPRVSSTEFIAPVALMTAGLLTQGSISRRVRQHVIEHYLGFWSPVDDYLQFAPTLTMLGVCAAGVSGKHQWADQMVLTLLANSVSQGISYSLKYIIAYPRPDGKERDSFPSGHTTSAFTGATLLANEYGERSVWYAVGGYTVAATVGAFRVLKNRHWLADVLVGSGLGIGATEAVYLAYPWLKQLVIRRRQTVIVPIYQGSWGGFCLTSFF